MSGSVAEREIRDALVAHLHATCPGARVVHELNTSFGRERIDVAAITKDRIFAFEIKSERDTLKRLDDQVKAFAQVSHAVVAVLHEKWFDRTPYHNGNPRMAFDLPHVSGRPSSVWAYPEPAPACDTPGLLYRWCAPGDLLRGYWSVAGRVPASDALLGMLWHEELAAEVALHGVTMPKKRPCRGAMIRAMALGLTGQQVVEAVCRRLRARAFAEADPEIPVMLERDA